MSHESVCFSHTRTAIRLAVTVAIATLGISISTQQAQAGEITVSPASGTSTTVFKVNFRLGSSNEAPVSYALSARRSKQGGGSSCVSRAKIETEISSASVQLPIGPDYGFDASKRWCKGRYKAKITAEVVGITAPETIGSVGFKVR